MPANENGSRSARAEIEERKRFDADRPSPQCILLVRMRRVVEAQIALKRREDGAHESLRGALVDLAAICESLADDLPVDAQMLAESRREGSRAGFGQYGQLKAKRAVAEADAAA